MSERFLLNSDNIDDRLPSFGKILCTTPPYALAEIHGSQSRGKIYGNVAFYPVGNGTLIQAEVYGLPDENKSGHSAFFAMHIHEYGNCKPPFDQTGNHYNPKNLPHPWHAGDLPPLLSNNGYAWSAFFDSRFNVKEILQKSVIIHSQADDFSSQPSGNSGEKIACGVIRPLYMYK